MTAKFAKGDRVRVCSEQVASQIQTASRVGKVVQGDPDHGLDGTYQVMFEGEVFPSGFPAPRLSR